MWWTRTGAEEVRKLHVDERDVEWCGSGGGVYRARLHAPSASFSALAGHLSEQMGVESGAGPSLTGSRCAAANSAASSIAVSSSTGAVTALTDARPSARCVGSASVYVPSPPRAVLRTAMLSRCTASCVVRSTVRRTRSFTSPAATSADDATETDQGIQPSSTAIIMRSSRIAL